MNELPMIPFDSMTGAAFSEDRRHRYLLWRRWSDAAWCNFLMLNPSTADENASDPTATRCLNYAKRWGYGGLIVTNLFAYRSTDPGRLKLAGDPVGEHNAHAILYAARQSQIVVCAWGSHGRFLSAGKDAYRRLVRAGIQPHCLALNPSGFPSHPLYQRSDLQPQPWTLETVS